MDIVDNNDEPFLGWKVTVVTRGKGGVLYISTGTQARQHFKPGEAQEATCTVRDHPTLDDETPPVTGCSCGIYATKTLDPLRNYISYYPTDCLSAITRLRLWGKIVEYDQGYRAQFAYPQFVILPSALEPAQMCHYSNVQFFHNPEVWEQLQSKHTTSVWHTPRLSIDQLKKLCTQLEKTPNTDVKVLSAVKSTLAQREAHKRHTERKAMDALLTQQVRIANKLRKLQEKE